MEICAMCLSNFLLEFVFNQIPILLNYLCDKSSLYERFFGKFSDGDDLSSSDSQESLSDMGENGIWFDGVDKKLIEMHTRPKESLVEAFGRGSLVTKTPLLSYKAIVNKRKQRLEQNEQVSSSKEEKKNGNSSKTTGIPYKDRINPTSGVTDELALDCEMVECYGNKSVLARVSVVNLFGHPILDSYVAPPSKVTDYRTRYSGIRKQDLDHAPNFEEVQAQVSKLIKDRIVVGHAVHNDFDVLKLIHPPEYTRDTSKYFGKNYFLGKVPSLKKLSESVLGVKIQTGEHDSVQDAQATMKLYVTVREKWEDTMLKRSGHKAVRTKANGQKKKKQKMKPKKKRVKAFFVETI